jgi:hypothetical protein
MRPSNPIQRSKENKTWEELCKETYIGNSNSLEASHELIYYQFRRHLGMNPEDVNKLPMRRMRAWLTFMAEEKLIDDKKHMQMCEIIAKIGGLKLRK